MLPSDLDIAKIRLDLENRKNRKFTIRNYDLL